MEKSVPAPGGSSPVEDQLVSTYVKPQYRPPHDPTVTFEEFHHYALKTREKELTLEAPKSNWRDWVSRRAHTESSSDAVSPAEKSPSDAERPHRLEITDQEWENANRLLRTASSGACFYLITTDILGPFGSAFAMGTLGWGPGIALYTVFGLMAGYSGYLVYRIFLGVDSYEYPARNYGDIAFRTCGTAMRYITNFCQAIALLLITGQITIQFGENISQVSKFRLCYAVCPVLFVVAGFFITQIRSLKAYGWVANLAVWSNLLTIFISMGVIAHSLPNYQISVLGSAGSAVDPTTITPDEDGVYPPVMHYNGLPLNSLVGSINGLLSAVLAYAGVQLFVEFLAEMRRPRDFIKVMWASQFFIYTVYLVYGCFVYHYQGQYSFNPSYQGVSVYGWQTAGNMITLVAALAAAGLVANIGIKVFYNNILLDFFKAPPITTKRGKIIYALIVPIWWIVAFIIAAAIPDYFGFVGIIAASMLLNLTYTFPPLYALGFDIQKNALRPGEGFNSSTGETIRSDTTIQRWARGFFSGGIFQVSVNIWHIIYFLASLAMCGLGMYSAVDGMIVAFENPELNSFSCTSPLNLNA